MTDTPDAHVVRLKPVPEHPAGAIGAGTVERIDANFQRIDKRLDDLTRKAPRPPRFRSAAAARVNPDRFWFGMVIAAVNGVFLLGAFIVQFGGQYGFAPRTMLPPELWWFIPLALDLPIVAAAFTAAIYRRRKQVSRARGNWAFVVALSLLASAIQISHVLDAATEGDITPEAVTALGLAGWLGAAVMGLVPWIALYLSENLAGLLVRPYGEQRDLREVAPAPRARKARARSKNRSTKK